MPTHLQRWLVLHRIISAILLLAAQPTITPAQAQELSSPSQAESNFWTSTRQTDTVAAYQAYLNQFPNGFFASLASAAINLRKNGSGTQRQNPKLIVDAEDSRAYKGSQQFVATRIAGPSDSSAISQQLGDVYIGPGPITVGWLGAKKQIVVPKGEWVLLAAEDSLTKHPQPMLLTSLLLARLEGSTVRSLILTRFNSKTGHPKNTWSDASACESAPPSTPFGWRTQEHWVSQCVRSALQSQNKTARTLSSPIWDKAIRNLTVGGGTIPVGPSLATDLFYTGDLSNYLRVTRIDFGVLLKGNSQTTSESSIDLSVAGRERWARDYSVWAALGYRKKIDADELYPGSSATITAALLPD